MLLSYGGIGLALARRLLASECEVVAVASRDRRGDALVDTGALMAECGSGRLRAALDVTDPGPLPDGHPLFATPGVLITSHVAGGTRASYSRMGAYVHRQLCIFRDDGRLQHVVHIG